MNKTMTHFLFCAVFIVLNIAVQHVALNLLLDKYSIDLQTLNGDWWQLAWFALLYLLLAQMAQKHTQSASTWVFAITALASSLALPLLHSVPMHQVYIAGVNVLTAVVGFAAFKLLQHIDAKKSDLNT